MKITRKRWVDLSIGHYREHPLCRTTPTPAPEWCEDPEAEWVTCTDATCPNQGQRWNLPSYEEVHDL